jgi:hydrogenase maturation protease
VSGVLVAGVGNIFLQDDAFGSEVARRLDGAAMGDGIEVVDVGIAGTHLALRLLDGYDALVLVDAIQRGAPPGTLTVLEPTAEDIARVDSDGSLPTHELDPLALLALARAWDCLPPRVLVVGCEAGSVGEGLGMTDSVAGAVDAAVQMVARVARGEAERLLREGSESR